MMPDSRKELVIAGWPVNFEPLTFSLKQKNVHFLDNTFRFKCSGKWNIMSLAAENSVYNEVQKEEILFIELSFS